MKCPCGREIDRSIEDQIIAKQSEYYEVAITSVTEQGKIISDLQQKLKDKQSEIERLTAENAKLQARVEELSREKDARVYYQGIVYSVCNTLDRINNRPAGKGIVCGTLESPTTEVEDAMKALTSQLEEAKGEWRTGTFPEDGAYWVEWLGFLPSIEHYKKGQDIGRRWSGPIAKPIEP